MQSLIIEDEKPAARRLKRMLNALGIQVPVMLHSVAEAVDWFRENPAPTLIFIDIQLSDGLSFDIFEKVDVQSSIIFTTAYDEYALKAFKLNSVDYLLKPIDEEELKAAIDKYKTNRLPPHDLSQLKNLLLQATTASKNYKTRFTSKVGNRLKLFSNGDVVCFYSKNKATYLHPKVGRDCLLESSLTELESVLDPHEFFRVNRQYIIRIHAIDEMHSYSNSRLLITLHHFEKEKIIVSRERVSDFKNWLQGK